MPWIPPTSTATLVNLNIPVNLIILHSFSLLRKKILDPHMKTFSLGYVFSGVRFRQVPLCAHLAFTQCMTVGFTSVVVWFALVSFDFAIEAVGFVLSSFVYFSMFLKIRCSFCINVFLPFSPPIDDLLLKYI